MLKTSWNRILAACVVLLVIALFVVWNSESAFGQRRQPPPLTSQGPHYTVVMTEGHNLLVTDNATSKLYFYTIDKDKEIGSDLKLRGTIDLNQVGRPIIRPEKVKAE